MKKLKWSKDKQGNVFDIRDGQATFVIKSENKDSPYRKRFMSVRLYGTKMLIPFNHLSTAKKVAQLIYNG